MPDNTARITQIRNILASGATSTSIDGTSQTLDLDSLRAELRQLMAEDTTQNIRRPRISTVRLSRIVRG